MLVLAIVVYALITVFWWLFLGMMSRGTGWAEQWFHLFLALMWLPLLLVFLPCGFLSLKFREKVALMATQQERDELREENARLLKSIEVWEAYDDKGELRND